MRFRIAGLILILLLPIWINQAAPGINRDQLVYIWDGHLVTQAIGGSDWRDLGQANNRVRTALPAESMLDSYTLEASPVEQHPEDAYGFFHGVWSADHTQFAYLTLENAGLGYRVQLWHDGETTTLIDLTGGPALGRLEPLAFTADEGLLLVERDALYHADTLTILRYDFRQQSTRRLYSFPQMNLSGSSAILPDYSGVYVGMDVNVKRGYVFNFAEEQLVGFSMPVPDAEIPKSIFELYPAPVMTLGFIPGVEVSAFIDQLTTTYADNSAPVRPEPFLHWPLADEFRIITCYTDSNWTGANFAYTCPGLSSPRDYEGHQGTDISARPGGLPLGTPVYPSLPGVVVKTISSCPMDEPSCGDAYGNIVMLEHTITVNGETQIWFTGYAHLTQPNVIVGQFIRDLTEPIALSGASGVGGPHLHFEVRNLMTHGFNRWVDPWGQYYPPYDFPLWIGGVENPTALVTSAS